VENGLTANAPPAATPRARSAAVRTVPTPTTAPGTLAPIVSTAARAASVRSATSITRQPVLDEHLRHTDSIADIVEHDERHHPLRPE
jgi:hypothetical protein